eukprot:897932-Pleurochrysis_carterae.AAC.4
MRQPKGCGEVRAGAGAHTDLRGNGRQGCFLRNSEACSLARCGALDKSKASSSPILMEPAGRFRGTEPREHAISSRIDGTVTIRHNKLDATERRSRATSPQRRSEIKASTHTHWHA